MFNRSKLETSGLTKFLVIFMGVTFLSIIGCDKTKKLEEASGELIFYNWTDYTPPALIEKFEKDTEIQVITDYFDSNETLLAKIKAGGSQYDLIVPTHNFVEIFVNEGLIQKVGVNTFPNFKNIAKRWRNPEWDPKHEYSVPWQYGSTSFAIRSTLAGDAEGKSLKEFFEPNEEVCGKLSVFNSPDDVIALAQIYLGYKVCSTDPEELQKVQDLLLEQKKCVKVYSSEDVNGRLKRKDVVMSNNWDGNSFRAKNEEGMSDLIYAYPKEGLLTWYDNVTVPTDAANVPAAKVFMNYILEPEHMAMISNKQGYNNAIAGTEEFMREDIANSEILAVPKDQQIIFAESCSPEAIALNEKVWTAVRK